MSQTLLKVIALVAQRKAHVSRHAYNELLNDRIFLDEVIEGINAAVVVEDYPSYPKGPCVLVLQHDKTRLPLHILWGIPAGKTEPAAIITAYRPDPAKWDAAFLRRKP